MVDDAPAAADLFQFCLGMGGVSAAAGGCTAHAASGKHCFFPTAQLLHAVRFLALLGWGTHSFAPLRWHGPQNNCNYC